MSIVEKIQSPSLSLENRLSVLMEALTLSEKISLLSTQQSAIPRLGINAYAVGGEAAHGVVDRNGGKATVFPQPIGLSSTWNKPLMHQVGSVIGDEARVFYQLQNEKTGLTLWAPTIDMERDPRWGRTEEAYGEDPYLTGQLSKELIKGMQGDDPFYVKLVAAPKHFYGNNHEKGREDTSNSMDLRNRKEYYLKAFEPAFKEANALSMMTAYNGVNGIPCMQIHEIEEIVRNEWEMDGFIVSDGGALTLNVEEYQYYATFEDALADALKKGIDCFVDRKEIVEEAAKNALDKQLIEPQDMDRAIRRMLKVRFRLGHFDQDPSQNPYHNLPLDVMCSEEHSKLARKATDESIVLLKNDQEFLPLRKNKLEKLAVIGPTANDVFRDWYTGYPPYKVTPLAGIKEYLPDVDISYHDGFDRIVWKPKLSSNHLGVNEENHWVATQDDVSHAALVDEDWGNGWHVFKSVKTNHYLTQMEKAPTFSATKEEIFDWFNREKISVRANDQDLYTLNNWNGYPLTVEQNKVTVNEKDAALFEKKIIENGIQEAVDRAKESDVAIVCVGNHPMINGKETEDRQDIKLADYQQRLVQAVYQANPNMVLVVFGSYPFAINWEQDHIPAIIYSSHGSQELGHSLAATIFGGNNPSGKLSMTWYRDADLLPDITDYDIRKGKRTYQYADANILYPFGHGLSYGTVTYQDVHINKNVISENEKISISVTLKNQSDFNRLEVVQVYADVTGGYYPRANKQLVAFEKVLLLPDQEKQITLSMDTDQLKVFDVRTNQFVLEQGMVHFHIGQSSEQFVFTSAPVTIKGEVITRRSLEQLTSAENYDDYEHITLTKGEMERPCVTADQQGWILFRNVQYQSKAKLKVRVKGENGQLSVYANDRKNSPVTTQKIAANQWTDQIIDWHVQNSEPSDIILEIKQLSIQSIQLMEG
ncbi:beta-glucosidase [Gracilibacillus orientalis]|uniref:Beta-glucosidase n=1 Tax=Gracilibacillus orientalis TaxID=334253 RepID=A0A1I4IEG4_9BACI|nr:glycoside hydrolase family 3 protein [Gracilibacillus orientalis]SFL52146.1 beta-glucosidase [Gracilibacillus orientalis]